MYSSCNNCDEYDSCSDTSSDTSSDMSSDISSDYDQSSDEDVYSDDMDDILFNENIRMLEMIYTSVKGSIYHFHTRTKNGERYITFETKYYRSVYYNDDYDIAYNIDGSFAFYIHWITLSCSPHRQNIFFLNY